VLGVLSAGLLLAFAACGDGENGGGGGASPTATLQAGGAPLKIGLVLSYTGEHASFGLEHESAARLAVEHINKAGGVLGSPVELAFADDGSSTTTGETAARRLLDSEGVHAIVGGGIGAPGSTVSVAVAENVTAPARILQVSAASTSPALTNADDDDFLFRVPLADTGQGVVLSQLVDDLAFSSVCVMFVNNPYGQGLSDAFAAAFEAGGGTVTARVSYPDQTAATTYAAELDQCVEDSPEALVAIGYSTGQAEVYLQEAVSNNLIDQFVFVEGTRDHEMFAALGWDAFDGMKGTGPGALPPSQFTEAFDAAYGEEYGELYQVAFTRETYDAVIAIALAAEKAGSTDGADMRDALRDIGNAPGDLVAEPPGGIAGALEAVRNGGDIDYSGASGSVEWDESGDAVLGAVEVWSVDAAAQKLVVEQTFRVDLQAGNIAPIEAASGEEEEPTPTSSLRFGHTAEWVMSVETLFDLPRWPFDIDALAA
jgi:ABC-type branched-subunit amino acid transport system substrate-binding protein